MHIVLGLLVAFIVVALYARRNRVTRHCRWRADRDSNRDGLHRYICAACGHEAFTADARPPKVCKAGEPF